MLERRRTRRGRGRKIDTVGSAHVPLDDAAERDRRNSGPAFREMQMALSRAGKRFAYADLTIALSDVAVLVSGTGKLDSRFYGLEFEDWITDSERAGELMNLGRLADPAAANTLQCFCPRSPLCAR